MLTEAFRKFMEMCITKKSTCEYQIEFEGAPVEN